MTNYFYFPTAIILKYSYHIQIMKKYMKLWHIGCIGSLKCWLISKLNFNMAKILGILPNSNCKKHILYSKQLVDIQAEDAYYTNDKIILWVKFTHVIRTTHKGVLVGHCYWLQPYRLFPVIQRWFSAML